MNTKWLERMLYELWIGRKTLEVSLRATMAMSVYITKIWNRKFLWKPCITMIDSFDAWHLIIFFFSDWATHLSGRCLRNHFTLLWQWSKILPGFVRPKASIIIDLLGNSPIASVAWRSLCSPSEPGFYHSWLWAGRWGPSLSCRRCRFSASCMEDNLSSIFLLWGWKLCLTLSVP